MTDPPSQLYAALAEHYQIERELGAGGMATVYLAQDLKHHRKVALKVLRSELSASLGPERFIREITIAAGLSHPHILPLYDSGEAAGFLYYVMPFVEGHSLRQKLIRERELPVYEAIRILRDMADAMAYAHAHGVVHRDIKPENVMLSGRHALVMDFGVAKAVSEATGRQTLTTAGVALGTPTYMAPEQAVADPHVDHRADIYAWGVVAYELLAGQPPFVRATPQAMLAAHVTEAVEPVSKHRGTISPGLTTLVMRALEKRPADRWQQADELVTQLETLLTPSGGMTPTATQPITAAVAPATPSRRSWLAVAGGVLLVAVTVGTVLLWPSAREYVANRVVVVPLESPRGNPSLEEFGRQLVETLTDAIGQEGVGDPVPAARVRDLLAGADEASADVADRLARETTAGLVLRGACSPKGGRTECQLELLRMPGRVPRLSFTVVGELSDPRFSAELAERATVILLLQQHWGDRPLWRGEHIPRSLEAVREFNEAFDLWTVGDTGAARHFLRAASLDTAWVLPAAWHATYLPPPLQDSILETLGRRPGLRASDREVIGATQALLHGDLDRAYDLRGRRFAVHPEMWLAAAIASAYFTERPETALSYLQYADSVSRLRGAQLAGMYFDAGRSLHHLGRYQEEVKLAARMRERLPEYPTQYRTVEIQGRAGAGDLDGVRRVVEEAEASIEPGVGGYAGTRAYIAGVELMAHGRQDEGRRLLAGSLSFFQRLREARGEPNINEVWALAWTDQLDQARTAALEALGTLKTPVDSIDTLGQLGCIAARQGSREEALRYSTMLAELNRRPYMDGRPAFQRARIAARLGEREVAVRLLQEARLAGQSSAFHWWIHRDPEFASLRGYPPFEQLLKPKG